MSAPTTDHRTESTHAPDVAEASESKGWRVRRSLVVLGAAVILVFGVVLGFGAGWLTQEDAGSDPSYVISNSVVLGTELTERQQEMVEVARRYANAWIQKDGDAVAALMTPDGYVAFPTLGNRTVRADDGTLQAWVEGLGAIPNELTNPIIVDDNRVVLVGRASASLDWMVSIEFTTSGDVLIVSDTHWAS